MCDFTKGFILCTCVEAVAQNAQKQKPRKKKKKQAATIEYKWVLYRFIGPVKEKEVGRYLAPGSDIGNGLTADFVLQKLQDKNCFDFEYSPNEGDNLVITQAQTLSRLEFIYRDDQWVEAHYSPFDYELEEIEKGKLRNNK